VRPRMGGVFIDYPRKMEEHSCRLDSDDLGRSTVPELNTYRQGGIRRAKRFAHPAKCGFSPPDDQNCDDDPARDLLGTAAEAGRRTSALVEAVVRMAECSRGNRRTATYRQPPSSVSSDGSNGAGAVGDGARAGKDGWGRREAPRRRLAPWAMAPF
jgi:hypothetical protein